MKARTVKMSELSKGKNLDLTASNVFKNQLGVVAGIDPGDAIQRMESLGEDANQAIYTLSVSDLLTVMEERGMLQSYSDAEVLALADHMRSRLEIPWTEYFETFLDNCHE